MKNKLNWVGNDHTIKVLKKCKDWEKISIIAYYPAYYTRDFFPLNSYFYSRFDSYYNYHHYDYQHFYFYFDIITLTCQLSPVRLSTRISD